MRFFKTAWWVRQMLPQYTWKIDTQQPTIYLTFDDGPIPEVTEYVLDQLKQYQAKATFFCVGDNVRKHPEIYQQLIAQGHRTGNHTYHHLNGWKTDDEAYLNNVEQCYQTMNEAGSQPLQPLFRPPYGKIKRNQMKQLKARYRIIMWEVLTYDFDPTLAPEACLQKAIDCTSPGSIVVFHDSVKSIDKLRYVLPRYLAHFADKGFGFEAIGEEF